MDCDIYGLLFCSFSLYLVSTLAKYLKLKMESERSLNCFILTYAEAFILAYDTIQPF